MVVYMFHKLLNNNGTWDKNRVLLVPAWQRRVVSNVVHPSVPL